MFNKLGGGVGLTTQPTQTTQPTHPSPTNLGAGSPELLGRFKVIIQIRTISQSQNPVRHVHGALEPGLHILSAAWHQARSAPAFIERLIFVE